jgi:hypothetical protein
MAVLAVREQLLVFPVHLLLMLAAVVVVVLLLVARVVLEVAALAQHLVRLLRELQTLAVAAAVVMLPQEALVAQV